MEPMCQPWLMQPRVRGFPVPPQSALERADYCHAPQTHRDPPTWALLHLLPQKLHFAPFKPANTFTPQLSPHWDHVLQQGPQLRWWMLPPG